jgi:hypothetical protein
LLSLLYQKWEAYASLSQSKAESIVKEILEQEKTIYQRTKKPPIYMYDAEKEQVIFKTDELEIALIYVSADPLTRMFSTIIGTKNHFDGITYLSINYEQSSQLALKTFLTQFNMRISHEPWKITTYPRFQFAFLLQHINKRKWLKAIYS